MGVKEVFAFVFFALMALGIFGASHLSDGGSLWSEGVDIDTVVIGSDGLETVSERYTPETERAWCLYGGVEGDTAVVERVIWDSEAEGSRTNVEFDCVRDVGIPEGTKYLGHIHSHPPESEARPSSLDEGSNRVSGIRIMGIYNGDELNLFEGESVTAALDGSDSGPERLRLRVEG